VNRAPAQQRAISAHSITVGVSRMCNDDYHQVTLRRICCSYSDWQ